eukprot:gene16122-19424_t
MHSQVLWAELSGYPGLFFDEIYRRSHKLSAHVAKNARELLLKEYRGALATLSKAMPGFPFGSVVPYCLDAEGRPLILISRIAQHTHNLQKDPKCSLLVGEREADDVQAVGRLTYLAEAEKLEDDAAIEAAAERYYRYFPESANYHKAHDFDFWVLKPAIAHYVELAGLPTSEPAQLAGIDSEGMHLRIGQALYWLPFAEPCNTPTQVREAL